MDNNPFAPEHHQPGQHHQGHHQPHNQAHQQSQEQRQEETPPTPPPIPTFNQNFMPAPQAFTAAAPPQAPEPSQQPAYQSWPAPETVEPKQLFQPGAPVAPAQPALSPTPSELIPQPVVNVLSPRGVEYVFLTVTLFTGAIGLLSALLVIINGGAGFEALSFPIALLMVALPVFTWLFLRLKDAELKNPSLRLDASKRRSTQFIQIINFAVCLFALVGLVTTIFAKIGGDYDGSMLKALANVLVILAVSGGILAYYWLDEHRS